MTSPPPLGVVGWAGEGRSITKRDLKSFSARGATPLRRIVLPEGGEACGLRRRLRRGHALQRCRPVMIVSAAVHGERPQSPQPKPVEVVVVFEIRRVKRLVEVADDVEDTRVGQKYRQDVGLAGA